MLVSILFLPSEWDDVADKYKDEGVTARNINLDAAGTCGGTASVEIWEAPIISINITISVVMVAVSLCTICLLKVGLKVESYQVLSQSLLPCSLNMRISRLSTIRFSIMYTGYKPLRLLMTWKLIWIKKG